MKNQVKNFRQYIKESDDFGMGTRYPMGGDYEQISLDTLEEWLDDDGRTASIIAAVLGGDRFYQTSEGMAELDAMGRKQSLTIEDIGVELDFFKADIDGSTRKVVEIKAMGPGSTMSPVYVFSK